MPFFFAAFCISSSAAFWLWLCSNHWGTSGINLSTLWLLWKIFIIIIICLAVIPVLNPAKPERSAICYSAQNPLLCPVFCIFYNLGHLSLEIRLWGSKCINKQNLTLTLPDFVTINTLLERIYLGTNAFKICKYVILSKENAAGHNEGLVHIYVRCSTAVGHSVMIYSLNTLQ